MPPIFGGKFDFQKAFVGSRENGPLDIYLIIAAAYRLEELVCHYFERVTRRDFIEIGLHHLVSIFLILGAYFLESVPEGAAIAFLHDLADIFINLTRFSAETRYSKVTITIFVLSIITWILTRLIWFPAFIIAFY